jgi:hypothetical protein
MGRTRSWAIALLSAAILPASGTLADEKQREKTFEEETLVKVKLKYLLALPEGYDRSDEAYPMLLFHHGGGDSGDDLAKVKKVGPPKLIESKPSSFRRDTMRPSRDSMNIARWALVSPPVGIVPNPFARVFAAKHFRDAAR